MPPTLTPTTIGGAKKLSLKALKLYKNYVIAHQVGMGQWSQMWIRNVKYKQNRNDRTHFEVFHIQGR